MTDTFCFWIQEPDGRWKCGVCGFTRSWAGEGQPPAKNCWRVEDPGDGPGSELTALLKSLGLEENIACGCRAKARMMDIRGPSGCRAHFHTIVGWMQEAYGKTAWTDRIKAAAVAMTTGLARQINWRDPFGDLVLMAIERSETKQKQEAAK